MTLQPPPDQDLIIVGATGDLARRKLLPAIYNLHLAGLLPACGDVVGYSRDSLSTDEFRAFVKQSIAQFSRTPLDEPAWASLAPQLHYAGLGQEGIAEVARHCTYPQRLLYLAIPPSAFEEVIRGLKGYPVVNGTRVVVEKPFGYDTASARRLNGTLHEVFDESQIFRIDHYLGKETVQNILVFRFGNSVFERIWNRDAIEYVQITVAESIGVEGRGAFYEEVGALRDIIQNHVLQMTALLAMEPPFSFSAEPVRDEKAKVFHAMRPIIPADVVRGQYIAGTADGKPVPGYTEEGGVAPGSRMETFAAMRLFIDNWRWSGVPFYLRTGKRLPQRATEVEVNFRRPPLSLFRELGVEDLQSNHLTLCIQPGESITFEFNTKVPGPEMELRTEPMVFSYEHSFMKEPDEAYERLLHDAMFGDHTLFVREDAVEQAWRVIEPVLTQPPPVHPYPAGTWGPPEAAALIKPYSWHLQ